MAGSPEITEPRSGRGRRATRSTGDERERAILAKLEELLESRSFHEISIDDLARGAGISRSTFYFYFPSKEAVLLTLLDRLMIEADAVSQGARGVLAQNPAEGIRLALTAYFNVFGSHRAVMLAGGDAQASKPEVGKIWNEVRERWVQMATEAIEDERASGAAPAGTPARELAIALICMNEGVLETTFAGDQPSVPEDAVIDTLSAVWLNAIYKGKIQT